MDEKKPSSKNKIIISVIIVAFIGPSILSWFIFNHTNFLEARGTSNYGTLISPPVLLENYSLTDPNNLDREDALYGKWSMIFVAETCEKVCMENVYRMRQIHIGIGKHSLRVQKVLFLTEQNLNELSELLVNYRGQKVMRVETSAQGVLLNKFSLDNTVNPIKSGYIYISDPLGNLMMSYPADINPQGILKDLKKLLRASRIG